MYKKSYNNSKFKEYKSKKIVFATNYPYFLKPLLFPVKVRLEKSYIGYGNTNLKINKNINEDYGQR